MMSGMFSLAPQVVFVERLINLGCTSSKWQPPQPEATQVRVPRGCGSLAVGWDWDWEEWCVWEVGAAAAACRGLVAAYAPHHGWWR